MLVVSAREKVKKSAECRMSGERQPRSVQIIGLDRGGHGCWRGHRGVRVQCLGRDTERFRDLLEHIHAAHRLDSAFGL